MADSGCRWRAIGTSSRRRVAARRHIARGAAIHSHTQAPAAGRLTRLGLPAVPPGSHLTQSSCNTGLMPELSDARIQAKATIAAALIQSRGIDPEALASANRDISNHKLAHLRELTERIYNALAAS